MTLKAREGYFVRNAEVETALLYMAYNMRRAINMVGVSQMMAALT